MAQAVTPINRDPQIDALKLPPYSVEAEQSVLGGLLLDNTAWEKIADVLTDSDFYRADHRQIYRHISLLVEDNKPADALTVAESLERSAKLEEVGGQAYLGSLAVNTPSAANIRRYAEIVRERAIMRRLAEVGTGIVDSCITRWVGRPRNCWTARKRRFSRLPKPVRADAKGSWRFSRY